MLNDQKTTIMDNYDPAHKTSSVVSTASDASSLWDPLPCLSSGLIESKASVYDVEDFQASQFLNYDGCYDASLFIQAKEESTLTSDMLIHNDKSPMSDILNSFLNEELLKKEQVIDHTMPTPALSHGSSKEAVEEDMATAITTAISNDKDVASEEEQAKNQVKPTSSPPSLPTETPKDVTENDHTVPVSTMAATSLSSDQKRANHIASEQKRRNIIRGGFKDLTELIPTLKDINNSKSTILFKSVDYIKHLEKRNKSLKERLSLLQAKVQQKHRLQRQQQKMQQRQQHHYPLHHAPHSDLSTNATIAALLLHRNQQRQLEMLQEQLKRQQELLAKHNIPTTTTTTTTTTPTPTPTTTAIITPVNKTTFSRHHQQPSFHSLNHNVSYNSISIPVLNDTPTTSTTTSPILLNASLPSCSNSFVNSHTTSSISSTTTTAALVIPASFEDYQQLQPQYSQHSSNNNFITPSFTIPADENFHYHQQQQNVYRERLLSSGKLNHLREDFDYIM